MVGHAVWVCIYNNICAYNTKVGTSGAKVNFTFQYFTCSTFALSHFHYFTRSHFSDFSDFTISHSLFHTFTFSDFNFFQTFIFSHFNTFTLSQFNTLTLSPFQTFKLSQTHLMKIDGKSLGSSGITEFFPAKRGLQIWRVTVRTKSAK